MLIYLISEDLDLFIALRNSGNGREIRFGRHTPDADADIFIWDYRVGMDLSTILECSNAAHLILADQSILPTINQAIRDRGCILLKPVKPSAVCNLINRAVQENNLNSSPRFALTAALSLQQLHQEQIYFVARGLHDLLTPLGALSGHCALLVAGNGGSMAIPQTEMLARMERSAKRLQNLAAGLLQFCSEGRTESYRHGEDASVEDVVRQAVHEVESLAREKKIEIEQRFNGVEAHPVYVPEQIEQVLMNLLENSCKFTPRGGKIEIDIGPTQWPSGSVSVESQPAFRFDIRDSGCGIRPDLTQKVFEPYTSYGGPNNRSGGGLGLAICKLIVELHGGEIWLNPSKSGTHFSFIIPVKPSAIGISMSADFGFVRPGSGHQAALV